MGKLRVGLLSGVIAGVLMAGGCSEDPKTAIIGSWSADNGVQDLHFSADGSSRIDDHKLDRVYQGRCVFESGETMRCSYNGFSFDIVREVDVSGDELVLTSRSGQKEFYHRMH